MPDLHALSGALDGAKAGLQISEEGPCPDTDWINDARELSPKHHHRYEEKPHSSAIHPAPKPSCTPD